MFSTSEREEFAARGIIKREKFLPSEKLTRAQTTVFDHLEQEGIRRNGRWFLDDCPLGTAFDPGMHLVKPLNRHQTLIDLASGEAPAAASALLDGLALFPMIAHPSLLFTMPNATTWTIPDYSWHLDLPRLHHGDCPGVQIFAFLETVEPGGGGTLAVAGSHHLLNKGGRIKSSAVRNKLKREPYFAELMSAQPGRDRLMHETGYVGDVALQVVEMVGEPGDLYFMDLRLLHTLALNALKIPRVMLTQRYLTEASRRALSG